VARLAAALVFLTLGWPSPAVADGPAATPATVAARPSKGCTLPAIATGRRIEQTITVGGVERRFFLDVPETLRAGEPATLLFDFHGIGHSGSGLWEVSAFRELAPRERFITVYPDGLPISFTRGERTFSGPGWEIRTLDTNRDVDFTLAMLDRIEASYCIDRARVYSTGFSNGAFFSHVLACTHPEIFAAVAPVSGGWLASWDCRPARPVPVLIHHGRVDDVIDVAEGRRSDAAWLTINGCAPAASPASTAPTSSTGATPVRAVATPSEATDPTGISCTTSTGCRDGAEVVYCEGEFAHRWPASATARIWRFLQRHPLATQP
jgi:polyhydroxybutyrate depolymerase